MLKGDCFINVYLMIDDCFPKLEYDYISHLGTIGMQEQNRVVILPQMDDAWNDNRHILKSKRN